MTDEKREANKVGSSLSQQSKPRGMGNRGNMRVVEKPKNFKMAIKRLTEYMKEYSFLLVLAIVFAILSVIALVLGPNQINVITKEITKGAESVL